MNNFQQVHSWVTDPTFYAETYGRYIRTRADNLVKFFEYAQELADMRWGLVFTMGWLFQDPTDEAIALWESKGFDRAALDQVVNIAGYSLPYRAIAFGIAYLTTLDEAVLDLEEEYDDRGQVLVPISHTNAHDGVVKYPIMDIVNQMQRDLYSLRCFEAFCFSKRDNSVTKYRDYLRTKVQDAYADLANLDGLMSELMDSSVTISDAFTQLLAMTGAQSVADAPEDPDINLNDPALNDFSAYTGANPLAGVAEGQALAVTAIGKAYSAVAKGVATVAIGIGSALVSAFRWVGKKIKEVFVDPVDLEPLQGDGHTIDGLAVQRKDVVVPSVVYYNSLSDELIKGHTTFEVYAEIDSRLKGHWFHVNTIFLDGFIKVKSIDVQTGQATADAILYPKVLTKEAWDMLDLYNDEVVGNISSIPRPSDADYARSSKESYTCASIYQAVAALSLYPIRACSAECWGHDMSTLPVHQLFDFKNEGLWPHLSSSAYTNLDYYCAATGTRDPESDFNRGVFDTFFSTYNQDVMMFLSGMIFRVGYAMLDQRTDPFYFEYFPYKIDDITTPAPSWKVRTDASNISRVTNFIATAIVVVYVAVVAGAYMYALKDLSRWRLNKALSKKSVLDAKMWNGEQLTAKELKAYKRATKRIDRSLAVNGGVMGGSKSSTPDTVPPADDNFGYLISLVQGSTP